MELGKGKEYFAAGAVVCLSAEILQKRKARVGKCFREQPEKSAGSFEYMEGNEKTLPVLRGNARKDISTQFAAFICENFLQGRP